MNTKNIALIAVGILLIGGLAVAVDRNAGNTTAGETNNNSAATVRQSDQDTNTNASTSGNMSFSEDQRKMLIALGIDPDEITITPQMEACAEAKLGASRIAEIRNGAAVSMSEGMKLVACYE